MTDLITRVRPMGESTIPADEFVRLTRKWAKHPYLIQAIERAARRAHVRTANQTQRAIWHAVRFLEKGGGRMPYSATERQQIVRNGLTREQGYALSRDKLRAMGVRLPPEAPEPTAPSGGPKAPQQGADHGAPQAEHRDQYGDCDD